MKGIKNQEASKWKLEVQDRKALESFCDENNPFRHEALLQPQLDNYSTCVRQPSYFFGNNHMPMRQDNPQFV